MIYDSDFRFLCDTYKKSHIAISVIGTEEFIDKLAILKLTAQARFIRNIEDLNLADSELRCLASNNLVSINLHSKAHL